MELLIIAVVWGLLALAAVTRGADSRRRHERQPYRSI
jgi:hypothetical protein